MPKNASSIRSMTEEELASTLQDAFDQAVTAGGYKSPDNYLRDHPLARSFVRACGTSPMDQNVITSLASAFANEIVESSRLLEKTKPQPLLQYLLWTLQMKIAKMMGRVVKVFPMRRVPFVAE